MFQDKALGVLMKENRPSDLPKGIVSKLRAIRRRAIGLSLVRGLCLSLAVFITAVLIAMVVDMLAGWFDTRPRYAFTFVALAAGLISVLWWCIRPLLHRRSIIATAQEVDATLPQLEERWSTVTEISQNTDAPEVRGSETMIRKVVSEAESAEAAIVPNAIVSAQPLFRASRWLIGATAVVALLFALKFSEAKVLLQRFCFPGRDISLTQVTASPANVWVAKGEPLALNATLKGRLPKAPPHLSVANENGGTKEVAMTAKTGAPGSFQHAMSDVSDSFTYRVRSGDGQTPWQRITAVERPRIAEVKLKVTPPAYSKLPVDEKTSLPHAVRVLEGSELEVSFRSDQPLDRMLIDFGNGQSAQLTAQDGNWYRFNTRPTNSFTFAAAAINQYKLENKNKPSCRISVYEDLPPAVKVVEPSDDIAVIPGDKVNVVFEASDDLGVAKAEVIVATTKADGETNVLTIPVSLDDVQGKKQFRKSVQLDTKALGLKHGDQLSYVVQVTDTKENPAAAAAQSQQPKEQQLASAESPSEGQPKESKEGQQLAEAGKSEQKPGDDRGQSSKDSKEAQASNSKNDKQQESKQSPENESTLAAKAGKQNDSEPKESNAKPDPNEMSKRMLDVAGQCSACKPRNITVDETAGSYAGEKRKKLEIAIEPVLERLKELLAEAQVKTDSLRAPAVSTAGLQAAHAEVLNGAKQHIVDAQRAVSDLKGRTANTPYAFIGLQLNNIADSHVSPAYKSLSDVAFPPSATVSNVAYLEKGSFHIARARQMLDDLTKTYETVKRDQQVADAMQKLNKMHQIFLEDTQALLGSSKPKINSYDRKIAEVDDAYAEKLREMLEQKKKIMAELAKLLADDPRMLRRYMAMLELQGTSYRDQVTLLAERQKEIQQQVAKWNATPETNRTELLQQWRGGYAARQGEVVEASAKLRENMETWLPLDVKPDHPRVQSALTQAEKVVQLATECANPEATNAAQQALAELLVLRETLPDLADLNSTNRAKMTSYVANRLTEVESLITAHSGQTKITESLNAGDFPKVAEVVEHRIAQDTSALGDKLELAEQQVSSMSEEIAAKAAELNKTVEDEIIAPQQTSVGHLANRKMAPAQQSLDPIPPAFDKAEKTFDEMMKLILAKLDEEPPPSGGGEPPGADELLAMLEDEMKACEGLGIPCRPINVTLFRDWMRPNSGQGQGQGMGKAQAQAAQAQSEKGKAQSEQLEKKARESAQKALAEARKQGAVNEAAGVISRGEAWNRLASKLQKDLLQGRDNTPPEQYRAAIEAYFKTIAESSSAPAR